MIVRNTKMFLLKEEEKKSEETVERIKVLCLHKNV